MVDTIPARRKVPSRDEIWHRRTEDVNKELANDLRGRLTVEAGDYLIWTPSGQTVGYKKDPKKKE